MSLALAFYPIEKKRIKAHLKLILPNKNSWFIAKHTFKYLYEILEYYFTIGLMLYNPKALHRQVRKSEFVNVEHLEKALASGKKIIFFSGHFSKFFLFFRAFATYMAYRNAPGTLIFNIPRLEKKDAIASAYETFGSNHKVKWRLFSISDEYELKQFMSSIGKENTFFLNDVITKYDSYLVPFGKGLTFSGLGIIANILRNENTILLPLFCTKRGKKLIFEFKEIVCIDRTRKMDDIVSFAALLNQLYVNQISNHPHEWQQLDLLGSSFIDTYPIRNYSVAVQLLTELRRFFHIENAKSFTLNFLIFYLMLSKRRKQFNTDMIDQVLSILINICLTTKNV